MPKFIVLSGKKQAGKTTTANLIKKYLEEVCLKVAEKEARLRAVRAGDWAGIGLVGIPTNLVRITSFATPIKEFCMNVIGLSKDQVFGTDDQKNSFTNILWCTMPKEVRARYCESSSGSIEKSGPLTAREVMQIFGTDIMRTFFDYDIWAKAPFKKDYGSTKFVIIDDCRFPNEANIALEHDAMLIRLTRNPLQDTHVSEIAMDDYDRNMYTHTIHNDSDTVSLGELSIRVSRLMHREGYIK